MYHHAYAIGAAKAKRIKAAKEDLVRITRIVAKVTGIHDFWIRRRMEPLPSARAAVFYAMYYTTDHNELNQCEASGWNRKCIREGIAKMVNLMETNPQWKQWIEEILTRAKK